MCVVAGAADVTAALAQRLQAVEGLLPHFLGRAVGQDALVLDAAVEDQILIIRRIVTPARLFYLCIR